MKKILLILILIGLGFTNSMLAPVFKVAADEDFPRVGLFNMQNEVTYNI